MVVEIGALAVPVPRLNDAGGKTTLLRAVDPSNSTAPTPTGMPLPSSLVGMSSSALAPPLRSAETSGGGLLLRVERATRVMRTACGRLHPGTGTSPVTL